MILAESINNKWFHYVETSHLISFANQLTGLCMKKTLAVNRLNFRNLLKVNSTICIFHIHKQSLSFALTKTVTWYTSRNSHKRFIAWSVPMRSYFWSLFSCIRTEYRDLLRNSPYSVPIRIRNNSVFEHFSRSGWWWNSFLGKLLVASPQRKYKQSKFTRNC